MDQNCHTAELFLCVEYISCTLCMCGVLSVCIPLLWKRISWVFVVFISFCTVQENSCRLWLTFLYYVDKVKTVRRKKKFHFLVNVHISHVDLQMEFYRFSGWNMTGNCVAAVRRPTKPLHILRTKHFDQWTILNVQFAIVVSHLKAKMALQQRKNTHTRLKFAQIQQFIFSKHKISCKKLAHRSWQVDRN